MFLHKFSRQQYGEKCVCVCVRLCLKWTHARWGGEQNRERVRDWKLFACFLQNWIIIIYLSRHTRKRINKTLISYLISFLRKTAIFIIKCVNLGTKIIKWKRIILVLFCTKEPLLAFYVIFAPSFSVLIFLLLWGADSGQRSPQLLWFTCLQPVVLIRHISWVSDCETLFTWTLIIPYLVMNILCYREILKLWKFSGVLTCEILIGEILFLYLISII